MENLTAEGYFHSIYVTASNNIKSKTLSKDSVLGYIRHLPIKGDTSYNGWGEKVLAISDKCLHELWEYSKEMDYIDKDAPYKVFLRRKF